MDARERMIVGLDLSSVDEAQAMVERLGDTVSFYKIGYQLGYAGGLNFARELIESGKKVFLDLKLLDIDNTVAKGVESIANMGVSMLTLHAYPKAMRVAVDAAKGSDICLLGVTVLTSMDDADLVEAGYSMDAVSLVEKRAGQAVEAGMGGIVCSAKEASLVRSIVGPEMAVVTPGIRPAGVSTDDQKRVVTPSAAISSGVSHIVVARPVIKAADPKAAAEAIIDEIASAAAAA